MKPTFCAVFRNPFNNEPISALEEVLNQCWQPFEEFWPSYEIVDRSEDDVLGEVFWNWRDLEGTSPKIIHFTSGGLFNLQGPCGFECLACPNVIGVLHGTPWSSFLREKTVRFILRETSRLFAQVFESPNWFYLPSSSGVVRLRDRARDSADLAQLAGDLRVLTGGNPNHLDDERQDCDRVAEDIVYMEDSLRLGSLI